MRRATALLLPLALIAGALALLRNEPGAEPGPAASAGDAGAPRGSRAHA